MRFIKPLLGLALLVGLVSLTDIPSLLVMFRNADPLLFGCALILAILANVLCTYRWLTISQSLGLTASLRLHLSAYAQGISINSVLPGGIIGGDAWRSRLIARSNEHPGRGHIALLSVLLDRVSGFWGLTWLSLSAGLVTVLSHTTEAAPPGWFSSPIGNGYLLALLLIAIAPLVGYLSHRVWLSKLSPLKAIQIFEVFIEISNALPILWRTLPLSVVIQVITVLAFSLCLLSVGVHVPWWLLNALCGGVFLSAVLPAALGGFGARELGAVALITPFGFSKEGVLAGSLLFGLCSTIQGVIGLWFWFHREDQRPNAN